MKNIIRWVVCALAVVVIAICFVSIISSISLAGQSDVSKADKSAALSTMFSSIAILMVMVGVFLVSLIKILQNDEDKLTYAALLIGAIAFVCMVLSCFAASDSLKAKKDTINAAKNHQRKLESFDNEGLVRELRDQRIIATLDADEDKEFLDLINDTERLIIYNSQNFLDLLEEKGLLERIGWKDDIWFRAQNAEYLSSILRLITNLIVFSTAPIVYGLTGLIKMKERFALKPKKS